MALDEDCFGRAAAQRFDSDRARARKNIEKASTDNQRRQHVENSLAQPVARGPQCKPLERLQLTRTKLAGDNAHEFFALLFNLSDSSEVIAPLPFRRQPPQQPIEFVDRPVPTFEFAPPDFGARFRA